MMRNRFSQKLSATADLIRLPKQYGTLLLLFPALWSLLIAAEGWPPPSLLLVFLLGGFLMRSAGCAINDIADQDFDRHVRRTRNRPIASGRLTPKEGLGVFALLVALAGLLALTLNLLALLLAPIGLLLAVLYPFTKRLISVPQAVLGITFGWGALMAWAAIRNEVGTPALLIFLATVFWAIAYDTIYALMDREDDLVIGVKSSAIFFGRFAWLAVGVCYLLGSAFLALLGWYTQMGWIYTGALIVVLVIFSRHTYEIKRGVSQNRAFSLFRSNILIGLIVLVGILLDLNLRASQI